MSKFQIVLTAIFGAFILIGVLIFSFSRSSTSKDISKATIWGTMSDATFQSFMKESGLAQDKTIQVKYVEKRKDTFNQDFVEALAVGKGPDLFFLPQDSILKHQDKIYPIPYSAFSERTFKDTFIEEGELYLTTAGALGLPFLVDPMVMYWNRDMFSSLGISVPPKFWSEMYDLAPRLTTKDTNLSISKSALAFGEHGNISNASELISLLILQAGNPITTRGPALASDTADAGASFGTINNLFSQRLEFPIAPSVQALNFYTEFANPVKPFYSWNRSLPPSKDFFLSSDLAMYFGFASELADIRLKNPNLNFAVAPIPQAKDAGRVTTFGRMVALAITKNSPNVAAAYVVASKMTSAAAESALSKVTSLPPVRRDLLAVRPAEAFMSVFFDGAVQAKAWLSPEPAQLGPILREMVESVTGGRANTNQAVFKAAEQLGVILK